MQDHVQVHRLLPEPWREGYESNLIAEWLRWLAIDLDFTAAKTLGQQIQDLVGSRRLSPDSTLSPRDASEIANTILAAIAYA